MSHAVIHADALTYLRGNRWLVQNGFIPKAHAILCDPPYGLAFMGKHWDTLGPVEFQAWVTEWAELLIDYVHPGALGLFFGGTRTYHRLATGLEDAGWEITDCMMWVQGQGFPKSAAIDKLLDKEAGAAREVVGVGTSGKNRNVLNAALHPETFGGPFALTAPATPLAARWEGYGTALKPAYETVVVCRAPRGKHTYAALAREFGTGALAIDAARIGTAQVDDYGRSAAKADGTKSLNQYTYSGPSGLRVYDPSPSGRWPANFALVCACEGDNHADDCPVSVLGKQSGETGNGYRANPSVAKSTDGDLFWKSDHVHGVRGHDDTGTAARFFYQAKAAAWEREAGLHGFAPPVSPGHNLSTNACARCGKRVKANGSGDKCECGDLRETVKVSNRANVHPTVKPIRLAEYLARLILPPELDTPRRLLVPFAGSGSEMIGARLAGWDAVTGIEREAEYVALAEARLAWWAQFASYDDARAAYEKERKAKPALVVIEDKPEQIARTGR